MCVWVCVCVYDYSLHVYIYIYARARVLGVDVCVLIHADRIMTLGSTQPLVKMSTRNIPGVKVASA
jgi:hypothetical protein